MHPWHHYVALGDSFAQGVGDPVEGFARLGVVARLAASLRQSSPDLRFTNLAQRHLLASEIREQQFEADHPDQRNRRVKGCQRGRRGSWNRIRQS